MGLITTNEPRPIKVKLPDLIECPMGFDIMLMTNNGNVCIERKAVPGDLVASISDGRLGREILNMREESKFNVVLLQGRMKFDKDGLLVIPGRTKVKNPYRWNRKGLNNIRRTWEYVEGCFTEYAQNSNDLVNVLNNIQDYFDKGKHLSMKSRPQIQTNWFVPSRGEKVIYFYQGLPGVATIGAKKLYDKFPSPWDLYRASIEDIDDIPRIGIGLATKIHNFLRGI